MKKLIPILTLILVLIGCSQSLEKQLIGTWIPNDDCPNKLGDEVAFKKDGQVSIKGGEIYSNWEINESDMVITLSNSLVGYHDYNVKQIDDDVISITEENVKWQASCEFTKQ